MTAVDLLIVGTGPAGMAAAITARDHGLSVMAVDEQPAPGGQVWRSVDGDARRDAILGPSYTEGRAITAAFRACGAIHAPRSKLWQIEPGHRAYISRDGVAEIIEAKAVILATGAQERPTPFPGWTLPGVMTIGAAQILLKSAGQIPSGRIWMAGCGPLALLYAVQLLRAGGTIAGFLDTAPAGRWRAALPHLPRALLASDDLLKGLGWSLRLRRSAIPVRTAITSIEAVGDDRLESVRFRTRGGETVTAAADILLVHEGVIPNLHPPLSLDCAIAWNEAQDCFAPELDDWGESSVENLFVAGDGGGIAGAKAAVLRGRLAALRIATKLGQAEQAATSIAARALRRELGRAIAPRPFLDALFKPRRALFEPADATIVCRCEDITAGSIRSSAAIGRPGPNQVKAATRCGMGPCQGRQCGHSLTRLIAAAQHRAPGDVGYLHVRPPLKPVTLGELASLVRSAAR